jgi:IS30 family transposase
LRRHSAESYVLGMTLEQALERSATPLLAVHTFPSTYPSFAFHPRFMMFPLLSLIPLLIIPLFDLVVNLICICVLYIYNIVLFYIFCVSSKLSYHHYRLSVITSTDCQLSPLQTVSYRHYRLSVIATTDCQLSPVQTVSYRHYRLSVIATTDCRLSPVQTVGYHHYRLSVIATTDCQV